MVVTSTAEISHCPVHRRTNRVETAPPLADPPSHTLFRWGWPTACLATAAGVALREPEPPHTADA
eukprot:143773-Prymnesium_polylepis.1